MKKWIDTFLGDCDRWLLVTILVLCAGGAVMLYSASSILSLTQSRYQSDMVFLKAHLWRLFLGLSAMFFFIRYDYKRLKLLAYPGVAVVIILLVLTKILHVLSGASGTARWLEIGSFHLQTADVARLALIVFVATYVDRNKRYLTDFKKGVLPALAVLGTVMGLIVIQPDFSSAAMIGIIGFTLLFIGGVPFSRLVFPATAALTLAVPVVLMSPYRLQRVLAWFQASDALSQGKYQTTQALISLSNGGFWGMGLGNSIEKNLFLPAPHTDFIMAIIGEELGLFGTIILLTLFLIVFQRGIAIAKRSTDPFAIVIAIGIAFTFILYAFINAAVVSNILPVTGLPMPLISYGGSGTVVSLASMGILLNISRSRRARVSHQGWGRTRRG
ncbi:MAG: cell division protein FtsW [FCB group bacterium]|nr:cell division protein FtsW [FCB group bacterium]